MTTAVIAPVAWTGPGLTRQLTRQLRPVLIGCAVLAVVVGFAVHSLGPRVGEIPRGVAQVSGADPRWLLVAVLTTAATFTCSAVVLIGATGAPLGLRQTVTVQLAGNALNRVTPAGLGRLALLVRYYECRGHTRTTALTATGVGLAAGAAARVVSVALVAGLMLWQGHPATVPLPGSPLLAGLVAGALAVVVLTVACRRGAPAAVRQMLHHLRTVCRRPLSALALASGAVGVNAMHVAGLAACLAAMDAHVGLVVLSFAYLTAATASGAVPVGGSLGVMEAALAAALFQAGVPLSTAVATVLLYRLISYWLPVLPGVWCLRSVRRQDLV